jgi:excinuclease ABC subunit A
MKFGFSRNDVSKYWNIVSESRTNLFSFNSPKGVIIVRRLGTVNEMSKKIIPNPKLSIKAGGFCSLGIQKLLDIAIRNYW